MHRDAFLPVLAACEDSWQRRSAAMNEEKATKQGISGSFQPSGLFTFGSTVLS